MGQTARICQRAHGRPDSSIVQVWCGQQQGMQCGRNGSTGGGAACVSMCGVHEYMPSCLCSGVVGHMTATGSGCEAHHARLSLVLKAVLAW